MENISEKRRRYLSFAKVKTKELRANQLRRKNDKNTVHWQNLFRQRQGQLTRDLVQEPGMYGLGRLPQRTKPDATTTMVCGYCSTGCGLNVHLKDGNAINITPCPEYPVNLGMACPKGWKALEVLQSPNRCQTPLLREPSGRLRSIPWAQAMTIFTNRLKGIQRKYGDHSVAFLSTGQMATEEMAFLGSLTKFGMNILHGDGNTRQCMATAVVAYKQAFGFDAPPYTYKDFEESDVILLIGSNLCIAHPIMWERIHMNQHKAKVIVIDPRATETAMGADLHYPIQPKSDLIFFYGLAHQLIEMQAIDRKFIDQSTTSFGDFCIFLQTYTPERVAEASGINPAQLKKLAQIIADGKRVSFWWTMGVNQSHEGVRVAQSIINIALMTGNIGRPGTGANSITGQCNAMGSRLFSNTTNLLGGHDFTEPEHRHKVAEILQLPVESIPDKNGWAYDQIIEGISRGDIKGLWVIATNSAHSWINQSDFRKIIKKLDFLVVQDMYQNTETANLADLILPAAGWGEKEGTFINSERRISLAKKVAKAPGQALADFHIFRLIAHYWGLADQFDQWRTPEDVFRLLSKLTENQPCDFSGITSWQQLDMGGIQWPYRSQERDFGHERRLFSDGKFFHLNQKARFLFAEPNEPKEKPNHEYPYWLLTGRGTSAQWHTQTRTSQSHVLRSLYPEETTIEINRTDARRLNIQNGDKVRVRSLRGKIDATANVTWSIQEGQVFIAMHYEATNRLTFPSFDPMSRQPSYKACAVSIEKPSHWEPV